MRDQPNALVAEKLGATGLNFDDLSRLKASSFSRCLIVMFIAPKMFEVRRGLLPMQ